MEVSNEPTMHEKRVRCGVCKYWVMMTFAVQSVDEEGNTVVVGVCDKCHSNLIKWTNLSKAAKEASNA